MRKQVTHHHVLFTVLRELRNVLRDRISQLDFAFFEELHYRAGRCKHLGERRHVEDRVHRHQFALRSDGTRAEGFAIDDFSLVSDDHDGSRGQVPVYRIVQDSIDDSETIIPFFLRGGDGIRDMGERKNESQSCEQAGAKPKRSNQHSIPSRANDQ